MILENKNLSIVFDDRNGSILSFRNCKTNDTWLDCDGYSRLFRIVVPDEENWIGQYCDSHQNEAEMTQNNGTVKIIFPQLKTPENKVLKIRVEVMVKLFKDETEAEFSIHVENNSELQIFETWFPWFGGFETDIDHDSDIIQVGYLTPRPVRASKRYDGFTLMNGHARNASPVQIPLVDISGNGKGITNNYYVKSPNNMPQFVTIAMNNDWDRCICGWSWVHRQIINSGKSFTSDKIGLAVHNGDRLNTYKRYKEFLDDWWQAPHMDEHFFEVVGLQCVSFRDFEGRYLRPLSDLTKLCKKGLEIGLKDFSLWDMMFNIYLRAGKGWFMEDGDKNRETELKKYVAEAKAMGCYVDTLVNFRLLSQKVKRWPEFSDRWAIKSKYNIRMYESVPYRSATANYHTAELEEGGHPYCQLEEEFQDFAIDLANEVLDRFGFNSIFVDQPFGQYRCFNKEHNHELGANEHVGAVEWIARLHNEIGSRSDYAYTLGELPDIFTSQYIELWWIWVWNNLCDANVIRYVLPQSMQIWVIDATEHFHEVNRAFSFGYLLGINIHGLQGDITEVPEFCDRIKRLSDLKISVKDDIRYDTYVGKEGLTVQGEAQIEANIYCTNDVFSIILGECARKAKAGSITLTIDNSIYNISDKKIYLHSEYGTIAELFPVIEGDATVLSFYLRKEEAAVIVIK